MARNIELLQLAVADVEDIYFFIGDNNITSADGFVDCLYEQLELVANHPDMAPKRTFATLGEIHALTLRPPYNSYLVFYRVLKDKIQVPRVMHGSRWGAVSKFFGDETIQDPKDPFL